MFGISKIKVIDNSDTQLYANMTVPISQLSTISSNFQEVRMLTRDLILANTVDQVQTSAARIKELRDEIGMLSDAYEKNHSFGRDESTFQ